MNLLCPVRACGALLLRADSRYVCERDHSFDVARSGYVNLLQPQDRRAKNPGDSREAVAARRRVVKAGYADFLLDALRTTLGTLGVESTATVLDVGCGEGYYLGSLAADRRIEAHGVDISTPAVECAARRYPDALWVVANADRSLPYAAESFDRVLTITARRNPAEFSRVLKRDGRLVVVVPGADDLIELREAIMGEGVVRSRIDAAVAAFSGHFDLESLSNVARREAYSVDVLRDVLASTYRGMRPGQRERADGLSAMDVTVSRDVLVFAPKAP